jgi:hypothetical protein
MLVNWTDASIKSNTISRRRCSAANGAAPDLFPDPFGMDAISPLSP